MLGLCRAVCAVPAAHVRCFTGRAVLSRELLYGIRPPSSAIQTHIASLARAGRLREAIVEAYSAARAHVDVGKPTILHLMTAAARLPAAERAECSDAVLRLSDMLLFTPETDRTVVAARLESTSPVGLPVCAASGPMPLVRTLTQREFESALSALAVCGHHARILQLAEHALHQNGRAVLSRQFLASVIDALASACASLRYSEARILETYAGARALLSAAGVQKLDSKLACCLLTLLLGGRHLSVWGATRRLASYVAVAAENSVAAAAAAVELTGGASEAAAPAVGGDAAHADAAQHTAGQVFHTVETAAEAAFAAARSLTARPEGEDPLLVAAATLLAEVPAEELTRAGVKDKLTFDAAGSAVAIADDGKGRGGVLPHLITLCVQRGRRDRALQLIGALVERGIAVPPAPFNQLILADAQGSSAPLAAARGHVRAMQTAGVVPSESSVSSSWASLPSCSFWHWLHLGIASRARSHNTPDCVLSRNPIFTVRPPVFSFRFCLCRRGNSGSSAASFSR